MSKVLLLKWFNTDVRSAVIALGIVVVTAVVETVSQQIAGGTFNYSLVIGAAVAAGAKFLHSVLTREALASVIAEVVVPTAPAIPTSDGANISVAPVIPITSPPAA